MVTNITSSFNITYSSFSYPHSGTVEIRHLTSQNIALEYTKVIKRYMNKGNSGNVAKAVANQAGKVNTPPLTNPTSTKPSISTDLPTNNNNNLQASISNINAENKSNKAFEGYEGPLQSMDSLRDQYKTSGFVKPSESFNPLNYFKTTTIVDKPIEIDIQQTRGAKYIVTERESSQNQIHPQITKFECEAANCNTTNCSKNEEECEGNIVAKDVGHLSSKKPSLDPSEGKTIVPLAGIKQAAIIHPVAEPIDIKDSYDQYRHNDTAILQSNKNTNALNEATKNQPEITSND